MPARVSGEATLRASLIPTASYVVGSSMTGLMAEAAQIYVDYTKGNETSVEVKVEFSPDFPTTADGSSTFAQETDSSDAFVEHQYTATGVYVISIPDLVAGKFRVSVKGTTGSDFVGSLVAVTAQTRRSH